MANKENLPKQNGEQLFWSFLQKLIALLRDYVFVSRRFLVNVLFKLS